MTSTHAPTPHGACRACRSGARPPAITMAFQPIVDVRTGTAWAHEALVRGVDGAGAGEVLAQVDDTNRYAFDQACRVRAITQAAALGLDGLLSINFLPNAIYDPVGCIRTTVEAATRTGFPLDRLVFELTEVEAVDDVGHLTDIVEVYRAQGFMMAIDDFGAGYAGLNLLADFVPDVLKVDIDLVRGLDAHPHRQAIVRAVVGLADELGTLVVGEGVETEAEALALHDLGVHLQQGYLYARPAFDALPPLTSDGAAVLALTAGTSLAT